MRFRFCAFVLGTAALLIFGVSQAQADWLVARVTPKNAAMHNRIFRVEFKDVGEMKVGTVTITTRSNARVPALDERKDGTRGRLSVRNPEDARSDDFSFERTGVLVPMTEKRKREQLTYTFRLTPEQLARARFDFFDSQGLGGEIYWFYLSDFLSEREREPAQAEERIAWGKTFNGLQGGLSFQGNTNRFKGGDTITLNLYWRNVTKEPVTISYGTHPGAAFRPTVTTKNGRRMPMYVDLVIGLAQRTTLPPGQTLQIAQLTMRIVGAKSDEGSGLIPRYPLSPGRYLVHVSGNERDSSVPVSGSLEFEVVRP